MVARIERLLGVCERLFWAIANTCLLLMLAANMLQIARRAVFDKGIPLVFPWSVFLFVWMCFFGWFVVYRHASDITVDFLIDRLGEGAHRVTRYFVNGIVIALMIVLLWHAPQVLSQQIGDVIELVELERWVQTLPLFMSGLLIMVHAALDIGWPPAASPPGGPTPRPTSDRHPGDARWAGSCSSGSWC